MFFRIVADADNTKLAVGSTDGFSKAVVSLNVQSSQFGEIAVVVCQ